MAEPGRTIRVRCATWDQVEAFYAEKLRGNTLVVKMPHKPAIGANITVALGLPDGLVFAIDGTVVKVATEEGGKIPVALRLLGLTPEVRGQLVRLVAEGRGEAAAAAKVAADVAGVGEARRGPPDEGRSPLDDEGQSPLKDEVVEAEPEPRMEDVLLEERAIFGALEAARKRLLVQPAHEILGVPVDADAQQVRSGYFVLTKRFHPDVYGRYRSPALRRLASDVFIHINRAFDRMRLAAAKGGRVQGPARGSREGWLADLEDMQPAATSSAVVTPARVGPSTAAAPAVAAPRANTVPGTPAPTVTPRTPRAPTVTATPPPPPSLGTPPPPTPRPRPPSTARVATAPLPIPASPSGVVTAPMDDGDSSPYEDMVIKVPKAPEPEDYADELRFTTSVRMKALTAEELFDDEITAVADQTQAPDPSHAPPPAPGAQSIEDPGGFGGSGFTNPGFTNPGGGTGFTNPGVTNPLIARDAAAAPASMGAGNPVDLGRAHLAAGRFAEACQAFALALRSDPRNRSVRALYHAASGLDLRARGEGAKAQVQLETALAHDRDCEEARRALAQPVDKKGIFKRIFDR